MTCQPVTHRSFHLPLHPAWVVCNRLPTRTSALLAFLPFLTHRHSTLSSLCLSSLQAKHFLMYRATSPSLPVPSEMLAATHGVLQSWKSSHHISVTATMLQFSWCTMASSSLGLLPILLHCCSCTSAGLSISHQHWHATPRLISIEPDFMPFPIQT